MEKAATQSLARPHLVWSMALVLVAIVIGIFFLFSDSEAASGLYECRSGCSGTDCPYHNMHGK